MKKVILKLLVRFPVFDNGYQGAHIYLDELQLKIDVIEAYISSTMNNISKIFSKKITIRINK